ncbi:hypothetical protein A7U60_g1833 [Sanghuangporus baumii]|uniref:Uncharacterized protein n=1 Tax=Sanghuangporus baumii TaxID=108892 RepID=A0A9Q5I3A8_SANBA|nr:hypothetical protein A7U60_g1833 [Sanghuangporus baumii]
MSESQPCLREFITVPERQALYVVVWAIAAAELGLTAFRVHSSTSTSSTYEPIVAELLAVSVLTVLFMPFIFLFLRRSTYVSHSPATGKAETAHTTTSQDEVYCVVGAALKSLLLNRWTLSSLNSIIWVMWLVGAAIATHEWPTRASAGPGEQGRILITTVGLAWSAFGTLTLARYLAVLEISARKLYNEIEKRRTAAHS